MPVKEVLINGDSAAVYLVFEGKHTKDFNGVLATGNNVRFSLMMFLRFKNGKIIEKRSHVDINDIIRQMKYRK